MRIYDILFLDCSSAPKKKEKNSFRCEICLKSYQNKYNLATHRRHKHLGEKRFACPVCGRRFATKQAMKGHLATHSDERKFKCQLCPDERSFKTKIGLHNHMRYHYEPQYACEHCGKKCYNSGSLKEHMRFHFEPTYACEHCDKKCYTSCDLKRHEKIHLR